MQSAKSATIRIVIASAALIAAVGVGQVAQPPESSTPAPESLHPFALDTGSLAGSGLTADDAPHLLDAIDAAHSDGLPDDVNARLLMIQRAAGDQPRVSAALENARRHQVAGLSADFKLLEWSRRDLAKLSQALAAREAALAANEPLHPTYQALLDEAEADPSVILARARIAEQSSAIAEALVEESEASEPNPE